MEKPLPEQPDKVWVGEHHLHPHGGRLALFGHLRAELVTDALKQALGTRAVAPGLIIHSDRGSQYGSRAHRQMLETAGLLQSMSARANPYHNAWTKSFIGTLKNEMLQGGSFATEADARLEIFDFIESYYNHHRKHSALSYQSPAQFKVKN